MIWSQVHLRTDEQAKLFEVSQALIRKLNPGVHTLVIDNASPIDPRPYADPDMWFRTPDAIGHFFHDVRGINGKPPRDGPGRAHTLAWSIAMAMGYERGVYIEADALFFRPVEWGFSQMTKPIACQPRGAYYELDWHVWWIRDFKWFREFDFIGKYDWQNRVGEPGGEPAGEKIYIRIFGDNAQPLPIRGERGDALQLSGANFDQHFPDGIDLLTHVDIGTFQWVLWKMGHGELASRLT